MHEATEHGCPEELNPQSSGQAVALEDGDLVQKCILTSVTGEADQNRKLHVNSPEPTAHVHSYSVVPYSMFRVLQGPMLLARFTCNFKGDKVHVIVAWGKNCREE